MCYFVAEKRDTLERNRHGKGYNRDGGRGRSRVPHVSRNVTDESEDIDHTSYHTAASACK